MKKLILISFVLILTFFGISEPAFAGLPSGINSTTYYPGYTRQIQYIESNSCNASAMVPYNGLVFYTCPDGQNFWAQVLVPSENSPLYMYFKNRKKQNDEDSEDTANTTTVNASFW